MAKNFPAKAAVAGRVIGGVVGFGFAAVGATLIGFLWFGEEFDRAPLFFKIMGSFVATMFVAIGGGAGLTALLASAAVEETGEQMQPRAPQAGPGNYVCPHCGGKLTRADVSPLGDVKCTFCGAWFNVHGKN